MRSESGENIDLLLAHASNATEPSSLGRIAAKKLCETRDKANLAGLRSQISESHD